MKLNVYIEGKKHTVELFNITYECSKERFRSLRASKGSFPSWAILDIEDLDVEIKNDFYIETDEHKSEIIEMSKQIVTIENENFEKVLEDNWFCFDAGQPLSVVEEFIQIISVK